MKTAVLEAQAGDAVGGGSNERASDGCVGGRDVDERDVVDAGLALGGVDDRAAIVHVHLDRGVGPWVLPRVARDVPEPEAVRPVQGWCMSRRQCMCWSVV